MLVSHNSYGYTLSSVFPTTEVEEKAMKVVKDKNEQDLRKKQPLTLKRELTKDTK